jgi:hypothetical protein
MGDELNPLPGILPVPQLKVRQDHVGMCPAGRFGNGGTDVHKPVRAAYRFVRAADLCPVHPEDAYPLLTVIDAADNTVKVGDG